MSSRLSPVYERLGTRDTDVLDGIPGYSASETDVSPSKPFQPHGCHNRHNLFLWLNATIFALSLFLFAITASIVRTASDANQLLRQTSEYCQ